jgi:hypothetical protein
MTISRRREESRDELSRDQTIRLAATFDTLKQQILDQGTTAMQVLRAIDALKQSTLQIVAAIEKQQKALPLQVLLQQPILFTDALNRIAPINLEWINSWDAFFAVLETRFKHRGISKVRRKEFALQEPSSGRAIAWSKPLDVCLLSGQHITMSMIFEETLAASADTCPHCHASCSGSMEKEVEW